MKKLSNIAILLLSVFGLAAKLDAKPGHVNRSLVAVHAIFGDTTGPTDPPKAPATDTSKATPDSSAKAETDPPVQPNRTPVVNAPAEEDIPASDLYEDFDTTIVHAEKFDALMFNDTIAIPLTGYVHPFAGPPTSTFGFRSYRYHFGEDINLEIGDSVKCAWDGKVRIAQRSKTYGYVVVVRHNNGLETYYAHLSKLLVHPGQDITAGTILGLGGNTGHSHGSHLHFEIRFRGQPINPASIIDFQKQELRADTYYLCKSDFKYLTETYKVRHYSRKKKKTWYTYYCPGGPHYATPEAKRIMAAVPAPGSPANSVTTAETKPAKTVTTPKTTNTPANPPAKAATKPKSTSATKSGAQAASKTTTTAKTTTPAKTTAAKTTTTTTSKSTTNSAAKSSVSTYYTVKKGDSLYAIAQKYGTTVDKLCQLNGISKNAKLQIGQKIRVK